MKQYTYDEYDKISDIFQSIKLEPYWPTLKQIDKFYEEPSKYLLYACYLYDTNPPPQTAEEKYSKKNLQNFINEHMELVE